MFEYINWQNNFSNFGTKIMVEEVITWKMTTIHTGSGWQLRSFYDSAKIIKIHLCAVLKKVSYHKSIVNCVFIVDYTMKKIVPHAHIYIRFYIRYWVICITYFLSDDKLFTYRWSAHILFHYDVAEEDFCLWLHNLLSYALLQTKCRMKCVVSDSMIEPSSPPLSIFLKNFAIMLIFPYTLHLAIQS